MRYDVDATWSRAGDGGRIVLAGSPFRVFRLTEAGGRVATRIENGDDVESALADRLRDAGAIHPRPETSERYSTSDVTVVTPQLGGEVAGDGRVTVDDASSPPLDGATIRLDVNRGPAGARNAGRAHADTELIAFVDADVVLAHPASDRSPAAERWWAPLLGHFDDPTVGLVAPRVTGDDSSSLDLGSAPARIRAGTRVSYVPAATIVVRASAFDDVGGFDETLRFGEDVDLVWRLDQAGWRCRYEPARSVHHRPRTSVLARVRQQIGYGSSSAPLALRHPGALAPVRSNGWTAAVWSAAALGHPVVGAGIAVASSAALVPKLSDVDPAVSLRIAATGHLQAGRQVATAVRRAWWPIVLVASLVSRRARWIGLLAVLEGPRRVLVDVSFGWGMWSGMIRHREWGPIIPSVTSWPARTSARASVRTSLRTPRSAPDPDRSRRSSR